MLAPVVPVPPSFDESLDIGKGDAVFPVRVLELVGERRKLEFSAEKIELIVGDGECESCLGHCGNEERARGYMQLCRGFEIGFVITSTSGKESRD